MDLECLKQLIAELRTDSESRQRDLSCAYLMGQDNGYKTGFDNVKRDSGVITG